MIYIKYNKEERSLTLQGHANYAEHGKDIVCSAVSILVETYSNYYNNIEIVENKVKMKYNNIEEEKAFTFVLNGLKMLEENYKDNITIE